MFMNKFEGLKKGRTETDKTEELVDLDPAALDAMGSADRIHAINRYIEQQYAVVEDYLILKGVGVPYVNEDPQVVQQAKNNLRSRLVRRLCFDYNNWQGGEVALGQIEEHVSNFLLALPFEIDRVKREKSHAVTAPAAETNTASMRPSSTSKNQRFQFPVTQHKESMAKKRFERNEKFRATAAKKRAANGEASTDTLSSERIFRVQTIDDPEAKARITREIGDELARKNRMSVSSLVADKTQAIVRAKETEQRLNGHSQIPVALEDEEELQEPLAQQQVRRLETSHLVATYRPGEPQFAVILHELLLTGEAPPEFIATLDQRIVSSKTELSAQLGAEPRIPSLVRALLRRRPKYFVAVSHTEEYRKAGYAGLICDDSTEPTLPPKMIFASNRRQNSVFIVHADAERWREFAAASKNQLRYCQSIPGLVDVVPFSDKPYFEEHIDKILTQPNIALPADFSLAEFADESKFVTAPPGWQIMDPVFRTYRGSLATLKAQAEAIVTAQIALGKKREDLAGYYLSHNNILSLHYVGEVYKKLIEQLPDPNQENLSAKGWKTIDAMQRTLAARGFHIGAPTLARRAEELFQSTVSGKKGAANTIRQKDPSAINPDAYHYEPELAKQIMQSLEEERTIPEGYLSAEPSGVEIYKLVVASGVTPVYDATIIALNLPDEAKPYQESNQDWVQNKIDAHGKRHDFYSFSLRQAVAKDLAPFLALGGKNKFQLSAELGISPTNLGKRIDKINQPQWIKKWRMPKDGKRIDIIMPPLIDMLQTIYSGRSA